MKVKELIEELSKLSQEVSVVMEIGEFNNNGDLIKTDISSIEEIEEVDHEDGTVVYLSSYEVEK